MPFFDQSFSYSYELDEQNQCKECHKLFGQLNDFTGELTEGDVVQCIRYSEYCIGCCP